MSEEGESSELRALAVRLGREERESNVNKGMEA